MGCGAPSSRICEVGRGQAGHDRAAGVGDDDVDDDLLDAGPQPGRRVAAAWPVACLAGDGTDATPASATAETTTNARARRRIADPGISVLRRASRWRARLGQRGLEIAAQLRTAASPPVPARSAVFEDRAIASARWPSAVSASPRPSAESEREPVPLGQRRRSGRAAPRDRAAAPPPAGRGPLRMSASWRIEDAVCGCRGAEQLAAHRDGLPRHALRLGRAAAVAVQEPGEIVEVGRHVGVPVSRDRAVDLEHLPEMGFGSSIVLLVLLDEGQVVEDGGERRVRLAIDLAGLGHPGVEHPAGLVGALQVAQHQAARRRRRDQVRPQVLASRSGAAERGLGLRRTAGPPRRAGRARRARCRGCGGCARPCGLGSSVAACLQAARASALLEGLARPASYSPACVCDHAEVVPDRRRGSGPGVRLQPRRHARRLVGCRSSAPLTSPRVRLDPRQVLQASRTARGRARPAGSAHRRARPSAAARPAASWRMPM